MNEMRNYVIMMIKVFSIKLKHLENWHLYQFNQGKIKDDHTLEKQGYLISLSDLRKFEERENLGDFWSFRSFYSFSFQTTACPMAIAKQTHVAKRR